MMQNDQARTPVRARLMTMADPGQTYATALSLALLGVALLVALNAA
jgi:hypothetical protein